MASHHRLDFPIEIRNERWLLRLHTFEYHEYLKAARRWESTGVSVPPLNLTFPVARYGVGLSFREVFGIEFCDTPQLAAGSFIDSR